MHFLDINKRRWASSSPTTAPSDSNLHSKAVTTSGFTRRRARLKPNRFLTSRRDLLKPHILLMKSHQHGQLCAASSSRWPLLACSSCQISIAVHLHNCPKPFVAQAFTQKTTHNFPISFPFPFINPYSCIADPTFTNCHFPSASQLAPACLSLACHKSSAP